MWQAMCIVVIEDGVPLLKSCVMWVYNQVCGYTMHTGYTHAVQFVYLPPPVLAEHRVAIKLFVFPGAFPATHFSLSFPPA